MHSDFRVRAALESLGRERTKIRIGSVENGGGEKKEKADFSHAWGIQGGLI